MISHVAVNSIEILAYFLVIYDRDGCPPSIYLLLADGNSLDLSLSRQSFFMYEAREKQAKFDLKSSHKFHILIKTLDDVLISRKTLILIPKSSRKDVLPPA